MMHSDLERSSCNSCAIVCVTLWGEYFSICSVVEIEASCVTVITAYEEEACGGLSRSHVRKGDFTVTS